jgi:hypothetical protein
VATGAVVTKEQGSSNDGDGFGSNSLPLELLLEALTHSIVDQPELKPSRKFDRSPRPLAGGICSFSGGSSGVEPFDSLVFATSNN